MKNITAITAAMNVMIGNTDVRKATKYVSPTLVVKVSRRHKFSKRNLRTEFLVTTGRPNYDERIFIKKCKLVGESFPVKKVQLKFWPVKKVI